MNAPKLSSKLLDSIASVAAVACAVNCSVLPSLVTLVPLASTALPAEQVGQLQEVLHAATMYVAVPVGATAVAAGFYSHKRPDIAASGLVSLSAIVAGHMHLVPCEYTGITAGLGAAGLLASQYWGRKEIARQAAAAAAPKACCSSKRAPQPQAQADNARMQ